MRRLIWAFVVRISPGDCLGAQTDLGLCCAHKPWRLLGCAEWSGTSLCAYVATKSFSMAWVISYVSKHILSYFIWIHGKMGDLWKTDNWSLTTNNNARTFVIVCNTILFYAILTCNTMLFCAVMTCNTMLCHDVMICNKMLFHDVMICNKMLFHDVMICLKMLFFAVNICNKMLFHDIMVCNKMLFHDIMICNEKLFHAVIICNKMLFHNVMVCNKMLYYIQSNEI